MKDWKTTLAGAVAAASAFVVFAPEHFTQWPWAISLAKFTGAGGLAVLGIAAQDKSKR